MFNGRPLCQIGSRRCAVAAMLPWMGAAAHAAAHLAPPGAATFALPAATPSAALRVAGLRGAARALQAAAEEDASPHFRAEEGRHAAGASAAQVGLAACLCGLVASLAVDRRRRSLSVSRRSGREGSGTGVVRVGVDAIEQVENLDGVESSIAKFVPKIHALQSQAESLRNGELKAVLASLKELRKTELRGVFGEVDTLLCALIDAIHGLRESAVSIRKSELRQQFEEMDRKAQAWVGELERGTVESLTGYRGSPAAVGEVDTMMEVHVVGLSHHSAPVDVREKLAVAQADWNRYAKDLVDFAKTPNGFMVPEVGVLSTCNRFELYFATPELKKYPAIECVHAFLRHKSGLDRGALDPYLFTHSGEAAINHLFEVSSGLDSLVLGEAQILAQVKACHEHCMMRADREDEAKVGGSGGKIITKMLNAGIRTGKLVRTRTKIGKGSVSVSSAAVELMMSRSLADLKKVAADLHVCIVGAGKMGRLLMIALFTKHPNIRVTLVNRSVDKAEALIEELKNRGGSRAEVAPTTDMWKVIGESDVVFAATASKDPIITKAELETLGRSLMLIDISVPRNIDAACGEVEGVVSYSVDDLKKVVAANAEKRQAEVLKAKQFIAEEVKKFKLWQASQGAVPYLAALQAMAEKIRKSETDKMARKLHGLQDRERMAVDKLTRHIIDAVFEPIYYSMKDEEAIDTKKNKIWALKNMFKLQPLYKRRLLPQGDETRQLPL